MCKFYRNQFKSLKQKREVKNLRMMNNLQMNKLYNFNITEHEAKQVMANPCVPPTFHAPVVPLPPKGLSIKIDDQSLNF